jgi:hypothetical protein
MACALSEKLRSHMHPRFWSSARTPATSVAAFQPPPHALLLVPVGGCGYVELSCYEVDGCLFLGRCPFGTLCGAFSRCLVSLVRRLICQLYYYCGGQLGGTLGGMQVSAACLKYGVSVSLD